MKSKLLLILIIIVPTAACYAKQEIEHFEDVTGIELCSDAVVERIPNNPNEHVGLGLIYRAYVSMSEACKEDFLTKVEQSRVAGTIYNDEGGSLYTVDQGNRLRVIYVD